MTAIDFPLQRNIKVTLSPSLCEDFPALPQPCAELLSPPVSLWIFLLTFVLLTMDLLLRLKLSH